jgi:hypothetical protein
MLGTAITPQYKRRSLRRAVSLECEIASNLWDGQVPFRVTDLSDEGLWLRTALPIECGEQVLVSFSPPRWPKAEPLVAMASVVRVSMSRRRVDHEHSGMALSLLDLDPQDRSMLRASLQGLPPPLHNDRVVDASGLVVADDDMTSRPMTYILSRETRLTAPDGTEVTLMALGPLLTGGRKAEKPKVHVRATETAAVETTTLRLAS